MGYGDLISGAGNIAGFAASVILLVSVILAWFYYPGPYSPLTNWISDLGNPELNPRGAIFLNSGFVLAGIAFFPFCFGLYRWHTDWYKDGENRFPAFLLAVLTGSLAGISMVMIGLFPENYASTHVFWAVSLFGALAIFVLFSAWHLLSHSQKEPIIRRIAYYGFATGMLDIAFGLVFFYHVFEWIAAAASLGYVALLAREMRL
jgi:hypothetical protein